MKILIIVAMSSELEGFITKKEFEVKLINGSKVYYLNNNNKEVYIAKSEVGKVNSAMLTTSLVLKLKPNYVINAGIAGGLNQSINLLDVIASSKVAYHDFDLTAFSLQKGEMDNGLMYFKGSQKLLKLLPSDVKKDFPKALACDMEGCSIAHVATLLSRKFLVIRCISDNVFLENHTKVYEDYKVPAIEKVVDVTYSLIDQL